MRGLVDVNSIIWKPAVMEETPEENINTYRREKKMSYEKDKAIKILADISRVCELEDSETEWRDINYLDIPLFQLEKFPEIEKYFTVKSIEMSHVDIIVWKFNLIAAVKCISEFFILYNRHNS